MFDYFSKSKTAHNSINNHTKTDLSPNKRKKTHMKYLSRYAIIIFFVFIFYNLFNYLQLVTYHPSEPSFEMIDNFETLKLKIDYLQNLVDTKQNDINNLKDAFSANVKYYNNLVDKQKKILDSLRNNTINFYGAENIRPLLENATDLPYDEQVKSVLMKLSLNNNDTVTSLTRANTLDVDFPQVIEFLPHLTGKSNLVQPKFKLSRNRFASVVIGIPTIKREKTSYLLETLKSLFDAMNDLEKSDVLIVVMIAEMDDQEFVQNTIKNINQAFKFETESGLLEIIVPPSEFYPDLNRIEPDKVFQDSKDRVKWRTKQNYDFSYLMTYCQKRGIYYLQLEDDVISKTGFFTTMKNFIKDQKHDQWMMIEFSQLGFIGKLFKCHDLPMFVNFFLVFATDKPVDWLYDSVFSVKICNPERGDIHCDRSKHDLKIKFKPSLFQHVGVESSLKGKKQKLKDKDFGKQSLIVAHENPVAKCSTSLKTYMKQTLQSVYLGQNFFWSMSPVANDYILFEFEKPTNIYKYYVKSGNPEHPDDKLYNATLHILPEKKIDDLKLPKEYTKSSDGFYMIDQFTNSMGTVSGFIDPNVVGKINKIRITIPQASETWIIVSEIDFSQKPDNSRKNLLSLIKSSSVYLNFKSTPNRN